jgi:hypothetical protein
VAKGIGVAANDVVHAAGVVGSALGGSIGTFIAVNDITPLKAYFQAGGALTPMGIVTVLAAGTITGLVSLAAKSPNNAVAAIAGQVTSADIQAIAAKAGADAAQLVVGKK